MNAPSHPYPDVAVAAACPSTPGKDLFEEQFAALIAAELCPENRIIAQDSATVLHAMAAAIDKELRAREAGDDGSLVCAIPAAFQVQVQMQETSIKRIVGIIDAFANALTARGLQIQSGKNFETASIIVAGESVRLTFEEKSSPHLGKLTKIEKRNRRSPSRCGDKRREIMTVKIESAPQTGCQSRWRDTTRWLIEERLNDIMIGIYRTALAKARARREVAERQKRIDTENARRAALRAERNSETEFLAELEHKALAWRHARRLREFIGAMETKARVDGKPLTEKKAIWLSRARRHADRIDPLTPSPPSPLDYTDRELRPLEDWEYDGEDEAWSALLGDSFLS